MHDVETVKLQEEFSHSAYKLQVEQDLIKMNMKKMDEIVDRMFKTNMIELEKETERKAVYFEKLRQEEIKQ